MFHLAAALRLNTGVKELYLADNELAIVDAVQLGNLLRSNTTLQIMDVSNNQILDSGIGHISDGLIDQVPSPTAPGKQIILVQELDGRAVGFNVLYWLIELMLVQCYENKLKVRSGSIANNLIVVAVRSWTCRDKI